MLKILRVIITMDPSYGGPCQGIRNSIAGLKGMDVQNEVVTLDKPDAAFLGKDEFPIYILGPARSPWQYSAKLLPWLIDNLHRYDVVIMHGLWLYNSHAVKKAIVQYRKQKGKDKAPKLFVMPHGMLDPYFQKAPGRKLKAIRNWFYWKFIENKLINIADGLLFTCQAELELARQSFRPYHPKKELNVGYGIEAPPPFNERMKKDFEGKCREITGSPYLLFLSRIHEKKGVDILLNAYLSVKQHHRKASKKMPKLVIAGPGLETAYGKKMLGRVSQNPVLSNSVFFPGMLTGDAKWGAFYGCEAFVLPSHQENFGIAVAEALACGKAVLISNKVNIWQEIMDEGAGIVANDDTEGFINSLNTWLNFSEKEKQEMSLNAKKCFEDKFNIKSASINLLKAIS